MKDNQAKYPQLRFKGFTDPWEQCKLRGILAERNDQITETKEYPLMSFVQGKGVTPKGKRYNRSFLVKDVDKKYKKTELGDFIYSSNNLETGSIGFNRTGKAVISPVYSIFKSKREQESQFIGIMSARKDFIFKMIRFRQGVVYGQWRIHESDFLNIDIRIPSYEEQQSIICFFEKLNKAITLQQRKLAKLKELKQGYLQKMFPQNGSKFPQLRFAGFADAWEQRKLGELGSTFTGLTGKTKEDFGHGDAKFVTYMNVFQNAVASLEQLDSVEIDPKQNEVKKGDVFFTTSSETPEEVGMSSVWKYNYDNVYLNSFTFGYRPNIEFDLDYLAAMLRSTTVRKKITFLAQGISRYNISKTKMMDIEVPVPSLEEQAKIGAFLSNVEQTITLHQRKLEKLQELKKGYLQKMFC